MEAVIGGDAVTQTLKVDLISSYYGSNDGYSFCVGTSDFTISLLPDPLPTWVILMDNVVKIQSMTSEDPEVSQMITVKVLDENDSPLTADRTFDASLVAAASPQSLEIPQNLPLSLDGEPALTL